MIASLIVAAPFIVMFVVTGVIWLVLTVADAGLRRCRGGSASGAAEARFKAEAEGQVRKVLEDVGIDPDAALDRRPHEFSGGQAQRISIARALILDPEVIICDEPVSALDVSVQAQVLNLLEDLKVKYGISLIFIAHDLAVVKNIADRVVVMYLGKICEVASPDELFVRPRHPYTGILMSSIPVTDPSVDPRAGDDDQRRAAVAARPAVGLPLPHPVPASRASVCAEEEPVLRELGVEHFVACHFPVEDGATGRRRTGTEPQRPWLVTSVVAAPARCANGSSLRRPPASGSGGDPPCRGVRDGRGRLRPGVDARHGGPGRRQRRRPLLPLPVEARSAAPVPRRGLGDLPGPHHPSRSTASATIRSPNSTRSSARSSPRNLHDDFAQKASRVALRDYTRLDPPERAVIERQRQRLVDLIADVIAAGVETGDFTIDEPVAAAHAILTLTAAVVGPRPVARPMCEVIELGQRFARGIARS